jgi:hypothetical protein
MRRRFPLASQNHEEGAKNFRDRRSENSSGQPALKMFKPTDI